MLALQYLIPLLMNALEVQPPRPQHPALILAVPPLGPVASHQLSSAFRLRLISRRLGPAAIVLTASTYAHIPHVMGRSAAVRLEAMLDLASGIACLVAVDQYVDQSYRRASHRPLLEVKPAIC